MERDTAVSKKREEALLPRSNQDNSLSWVDTFKEMAREHEDWSDLESTAADGLDGKKFGEPQSPSRAEAHPRFEQVLN